MKIGVLIPQSSLFPRLGKEFRRGLDLAMEMHFPGMEVSFEYEGIGKSTRSKEVISIIDKMMLKHDPRALICYTDNNGLDAIVKYINGSKVPTLFVGMGAYLPLGLPDSDYALYHSFDQWQSQLALGAHLGADKERTYANAGENYGGGYKLGASFSAGFEADSQRLPEFYYVDKLAPVPEDYQRLLQMYNETKPGVMMCNAVELPGIFMDFFSENKIKDQSKVVWPYHALDDERLEEYGAKSIGAITAGQWHHNLENEQNKKFVQGYLDEYDENPSSFSLLGYEAGLILFGAYSSLSKPIKPKTWGQALIESTINSPRGAYTVNAEKRSTHGPDYLMEVEEENGEPVLKVKEQLPTPSNKEAYLAGLDPMAVGGWENIYLCP